MGCPLADSLQSVIDGLTDKEKIEDALEILDGVRKKTPPIELARKNLGDVLIDLNKE